MARPPLSPDVKLSKALSKTLRHEAVKQGLQISSDGYVAVNDILNHQMYKQYTFEDIERVVATNDKQRFALVYNNEKSEWLLKANQGHSLNIEDSSLRPLVDLNDFPDTVVHGTTLAAYEKIKHAGQLSRMNRTHIHMARGIPGDKQVKSGIRSSSNVLIFIDVASALASGIKFFESENGVILSPGNEHGAIPMSCFSNVEILEKKLKSKESGGR